MNTAEICLSVCTTFLSVKNSSGICVHSRDTSHKVGFELPPTHMTSVFLLGVCCLRTITTQATGTGADGQTAYKDQDDMRLPAKVAGPPQKKGVEQVHLRSTKSTKNKERRLWNSSITLQYITGLEWDCLHSSIPKLPSRCMQNRPV